MEWDIDSFICNEFSIVEQWKRISQFILLGEESFSRIDLRRIFL